MIIQELSLQRIWWEIQRIMINLWVIEFLIFVIFQKKSHASGFGFVVLWMEEIILVIYLYVYDIILFRRYGCYMILSKLQEELSIKQDKRMQEHRVLFTQGVSKFVVSQNYGCTCF